MKFDEMLDRLHDSFGKRKALAYLPCFKSTTVIYPSLCPFYYYVFSGDEEGCAFMGGFPVEEPEVKEQVRHYGNCDGGCGEWKTSRCEPWYRYPTPDMICAEVGVPRVYFIKSGDLIKIGISTYPVNRLKQLQACSAHPLTLVAIASVGVYAHEYEKELHERFKANRRHGEWFVHTEELDEVMIEHMHLDCRAL